MEFLQLGTPAICHEGLAHLPQLELVLAHFRQGALRVALLPRLEILLGKILAQLRLELIL